MKIPLLLGAGFALGVAGFFMLRVSGAGAEPLAYKTPEITSLGKIIYDQECAACHGANLEGQPDWRTRDADGYLPAPPHDQDGHTWHHPDAQLFEITKYGTEAIVGGDYKSNMMGFDGILTDEEITAVLAFIKSTWPARIQERHDELNAAYEAATRP